MKGFSILLLAAFAAFSRPADAADHFARADSYLKFEANRIRSESARISGEANHIRSEAGVLDESAEKLRTDASHLDDLWVAANQLNPARFSDYEGRDRSQQIMRRDADRNVSGAASLRSEGHRLDDESTRLKQLAAEVDAQRHKIWFDKFKCCGPKTGQLLRETIVALAKMIGARYEPSQP
jgi:hypothetical protein